MELARVVVVAVGASKTSLDAPMREGESIVCVRECYVIMMNNGKGEPKVKSCAAHVVALAVIACFNSVGVL